MTIVHHIILRFIKVGDLDTQTIYQYLHWGIASSTSGCHIIILAIYFTLCRPINLLDDYENRWPYAFAFGAITSTIVGVFTGGEFFAFTNQVWAKGSHNELQKLPRVMPISRHVTSQLERVGFLIIGIFNSSVCWAACCNRDMLGIFPFLCLRSHKV